MKAQNHQAIYHAYWRFSGYLAACVVVGVLTYFFYIRTSLIEVQRIVDKTEEYDKIYVRQVDIANRIDSLYLFTAMFNTNMNDVLLQNLVSRRKQEIISQMEDLSGRDIRLYQKLMAQVNSFLGIKDSIRTARIELELIRTELTKCVEDNKQTTRKVTLGGITLNR